MNDDNVKISGIWIPVHHRFGSESDLATCSRSGPERLQCGTFQARGEFRSEHSKILRVDINFEKCIDLYIASEIIARDLCQFVFILNFCSKSALWGSKNLLVMTFKQIYRLFQIFKICVKFWTFLTQGPFNYYVTHLRWGGDSSIICSQMQKMTAYWL